MPKRIISVMLALAAALSLCGCSSIFADEYYYSEHYTEETDSFDLNGTVVENYLALKSVITKLVNSHEEYARLIFSSYPGNISEDLAAACFEVKSNTPVGAYAVDTLRYETSRIVSYYAADIYVTYSRSEEEMAQVRSLTGEEAIKNAVSEALRDLSDNLTFKYYSSVQGDSQYIENIVSTMCGQDPLFVVDEPTVTVSAYPETGANRIYEVTFSYNYTSNEMHAMRGTLKRKATEIAEQFEQEEDWARAVGCALYLSGMCTLEEGEMYCTAYHALVDGQADSGGIALAYSSLCELMGIECLVVEGSRGIGAVQSHSWNIIKLGDDYYHMDVSRIDQAGAAASLLLTDEDIWGDYLWEAERYPTCTGALTYNELYSPPDEIQDREETGEEEPGGEEPVVEEPAEDLSE